MRTLSVKYPTITKQRKIGDKLYVVEAIRDLDEAIDILCESLTAEEQHDPFAEDLCPYFGILWPASEALSFYLAEHPELVRHKTVLELGCGLGLPSLVASHLGGVVTATDYHPDVEEYFKRNCRHSTVDCDYKRLNWREEALEKFDVVIGSDVLYESKHPREVALGLLKFVRPGGTIILSDPGRAYVQHFIQAMNTEGVKEEMSLFPVEGKEIFVFKFTACTE
jgi:predicted nicotinamide N-methyase